MPEIVTKPNGVGAVMEEAFGVSDVLADTDGNQFRVARFPDRSVVIASQTAVDGIWITLTSPAPPEGVNPDWVKELWNTVKAIVGSVLEGAKGGGGGGNCTVNVSGNNNTVTVTVNPG
jgi:hypothetical protein